MSYRYDMTREEHDEWLAGLTDDQRKWLTIPCGWRQTLVVVSALKRALLSPMPDVERLKILEAINRWADGVWFTQEMLAVIEPMSDVGTWLYAEALKLHSANNYNAVFEMIGQLEVFDMLVKSTPSIGAALDLKLDAEAAARAKFNPTKEFRL